MEYEYDGREYSISQDAPVIEKILTDLNAFGKKGFRYAGLVSEQRGVTILLVEREKEPSEPVVINEAILGTVDYPLESPSVAVEEISF